MYMKTLANEDGQVGNEFASVETLWSQFENVMGKDESASKKAGGEEGAEQDYDDDNVKHEE